MSARLQPQHMCDMASVAGMVCVGSHVVGSEDLRVLAPCLVAITLARCEVHMRLPCGDQMR